MTKAKDPRIIVTWELAQGIASVLHDLAWWLGARAQRSRVFEDALRHALDRTGSPALPGRGSR
jgi:hypothetical protein